MLSFLKNKNYFNDVDVCFYNSVLHVLQMSVVIELLESSHCSFIMMGRDIRLWRDEYNIKDMCILPDGIVLKKAEILKNRKLVVYLIVSLLCVCVRLLRYLINRFAIKLVIGICFL